MTALKNMLDKSAWLQHHAALWGDGREWPEGATLSVCSLVRKAQRMTFKQYPADDPEAMWGAIEKSALAGHDAFISCGVLRPGVQKRGGRDDVVGVPALYVDIDMKSGAHSADDLPDEQQAQQLLADMPGVMQPRVTGVV